MAIKKISLRGRGVTNFSTGDIYYPVTDYNYLINKPSTFTPVAHNHNASDINAGVLSTDRIPTLPYSKVDFANQNLNTGDSPTFNNLTARGYYQSANGVPTNNLGSPTVTEMALFDEQFDNKTAFYPISSLTFETFDGTTWTDITSSISDTNKKRLLGGDNTAGISIPHGVVKYRITVRCSVSYVYLNALYMYWSSNGNSTQVHIWKKRDDGDWTQHTSASNYISSWPGHMYLPFATIPWMVSGGTTHQHLVRIEFTPNWTHASNGISLSKMQWWGGYPASKRNTFHTDEDKIVSFPNTVKVGSNNVIVEGDSRLSDARPASDVSAWAKTGSKPSYNHDEITDGTTYKRVSQTEKNDWNAKSTPTSVETQIGTYDANVVTPGLAGKVPTGRQVAGVNLVDDITATELTAMLNEATTLLKGLMSATDKARLNTLYALLDDSTDGSTDTIVDNISEVIAIFANYPEGVDIVTALANKLETSEVTEASTVSKVVRRNSSGDIFVRLVRSEYTSLSTTPNYIMVQHAAGGVGTDNYIRPASLAQIKSSLGSMPASDVSAWAKAGTKPSYNANEIGGLGASYRWLTDAYIATWNAKEPPISKGTTLQYFRGDMSLATMPTTLPASDVYAWAKAATKPSYTPKEVDYKGAVSNFDTALSQGQYYFAGTFTGAPVGGTIYGKLIVEVSTHDTHNGTDNWIWQTVHDTSGRIYKRYKVNTSAWTIWYLMYTDGMLYDRGSRVYSANNNNIGTGASNYAAGNDARLSDARPASDVYAWAKASVKPSYNLDEISTGTTNKHVTDAEKNNWNLKAELTDIESQIGAYDTNEVQTALALKAPLASPALTGVPTAPTALQTVNNTQIATTAYVKGAVAALVDASPGALDTLNELAAALGDNPNFATDVANEIGTKVSKAGGDTILQSAATGTNALSISKASDTGFTALDVLHSTGVSSRDIARFRNMNGTVLQVRGDGIVLYGGQDIVKTNDTRMTDSRPASDVYAWAKAATKPAMVKQEIEDAILIDSTNNGEAIGIDNPVRNTIGYTNALSILGQTDGGLYASAYSSSWIHEIYGDFRTGQIAIRGKNNGSWQAWRTVLDHINYGSHVTPAGIGAIAKTGDTLTGTLFGRSNTSEQINVASQGTPSFEAHSTNNAAAFITFHKSGHYAVRFGLDSDNKLKVGGWSMGAVAYEIFHSGNNNIGTGASNYAAGNDARLSDARPASDVSAWAKAGTKPTYNASEVGALGATAQAVDSAKLAGLLVHSARNNEANKVVRTDVNGYGLFGWINTTSGNTTNAITDVYVNTNDGYIRKKTLALFKTELGSMPASDVSAWAKASVKPSYNQDEVGDGTTYKRVSQTEKNDWNAKSDSTSVEGQIGTYNDTNVVPALALKLNLPAVVAEKTADYTLLLSDANKTLQMNATTDKSIIIPTNASVAFAIGTEINVIRKHATANTVFYASSGVTILSEGNKLKINAQYQVATIKKIATDTWVLFGALKS